MSQKWCTVHMPEKIQIGIRFCCPSVYSLNCYEDNTAIFMVVLLIFCNVKNCQKRKQKISQLTLRSLNNVLTSRLKLCTTIQFSSFTFSWKRFVEMQHWIEVLFNGGMNVLRKEEWAQKTIHSRSSLYSGQQHKHCYCHHIIQRRSACNSKRDGGRNCTHTYISNYSSKSEPEFSYWKGRTIDI